MYGWRIYLLSEMDALETATLNVQQCKRQPASLLSGQQILFRVPALPGVEAMARLNDQSWWLDPLSPSIKDEHGVARGGKR